MIRQTSTLCILGEAASVVLFIEWHRLHAPRDPLKAGIVASLEASLLLRYVMREDGRRSTKSKALKLSNFANTVICIVCRDFCFLFFENEVNYEL